MESFIPLMKTSDATFMRQWVEVCQEGQRTHDAWVAKLREQGVSAAHPDDGWVNRDDNSVILCYPQFNDGVEVGSCLVLGWPSEPEKNRYVEVTHIKESLAGLVYYYFRELIS